MSHATVKLTKVDPKKHVVKFELAKEEDPEQDIITNAYVSRKAAKAILGVKNLDDVKGVEVTVRIIK